MARKRSKQVFREMVKVITPPPYIAGQRISTEIHRGFLTPSAISAQVGSVTDRTLQLIFGGGKIVEVVLNLEGNPIEGELE